MTWDFAEGNPLSDSTGNFSGAVEWVAKVMDSIPTVPNSFATQIDASSIKSKSSAMVVSTDPPYYDNIGYADLSDFFYVWMRKSIATVWPSLFASLAVPKDEELVATPYRFDGGKVEAEKFFEEGLSRSFVAMSKIQDKFYPLTIYYAFKQAETEARGTAGAKVASTGWETMLEGVIASGFQINATWPIRTEMANRSIASGSNALASSIVLACRVRQDGAPEATRQQFVRELRQKLADDLRPLQQANIAPVDLAQAAIGPGMAIYSKYSRVREASGDALPVRGALALINQALDEVLAEQDEEYDNATRWAINWYESHQMNEGPYGDAEGFARARAVAVGELAREGLVKSGQGKVRFVWREEYPAIDSGWHPRAGDDVYDWVIMQRLADAVQSGQAEAAAVKATIDRALPGRSETARDLAYRLFNIAERKGWSREALVYNTLVQNWSEVERQASQLGEPATGQMRLGE
jgi:putative DNA methylase